MIILNLLQLVTLPGSACDWDNSGAADNIAVDEAILEAEMAKITNHQVLQLPSCTSKNTIKIDVACACANGGRHCGSVPECDLPDQVVPPPMYSSAGEGREGERQ